MTGRDTEYYLDILKRVRKGKPPEDDIHLYEELMAFDFVYALSLLYARKHTDVEDVDLELPWKDSMLLDCGKVASLLAYQIKTDDCWEEVKPLFDPFYAKCIEEWAEEVNEDDEHYDEDVFGGFAMSEFIKFKKMLDYVQAFHGAIKATAHNRLLQTMSDILLNHPVANGVGDGDI